MQVAANGHDVKDGRAGAALLSVSGRRQRMMGADQRMQPLIHYVGVDLRGRYVRMAEQLLHDAQIRTVFKQMGRKGMA
jgi:hypothetical protein